MKMVKRVPVLFLAVCFMLAVNAAAYAHEVPDVEKDGSISVTMRYGGNTVPGGTLTLYQVGEIHEDDGNYSFVLSDAFAGSGAALDEREASGLAESLAKYASEKKLTGKTAAIGNDGVAVFRSLKPGMYLVMQAEAADGYESISPFLVSVPMNENGTYVYEVDATPKMNILMLAEPDAPTSPDTPAMPAQPTLPYTGQLNWPVPALTALGLCLFLIGWVLRYGKKERPYET